MAFTMICTCTLLLPLTTRAFASVGDQVFGSFFDSGFQFAGYACGALPGYCALIKAAATIPASEGR